MKIETKDVIFSYIDTIFIIIFCCWLLYTDANSSQFFIKKTTDYGYLPNNLNLSDFHLNPGLTNNENSIIGYLIKEYNQRQIRNLKIVYYIYLCLIPLVTIWYYFFWLFFIKTKNINSLNYFKLEGEIKNGS